MLCFSIYSKLMLSRSWVPTNSPTSSKLGSALLPLAAAYACLPAPAASSTGVLFRRTGRDAHYFSPPVHFTIHDQCYGRASRTRVDDRRTQIVGCGTGSCHRLSLGHAHEQEGGDLGGGGFQLILQENGFVHIIRQENFNVIVEIVTAA